MAKNTIVARNKLQGEIRVRFYEGDEAVVEAINRHSTNQSKADFVKSAILLYDQLEQEKNRLDSIDRKTDEILSILRNN